MANNNVKNNEISEKIKISFDEGNFPPKFFVNEEKGIVVCEITGLVSCPFRENSNFNFESKFLTAKAKAVCSKNDIFDENRGKRIALAKAENTLYRMAAFDIEKQMKRLSELMQIGENFQNKSIEYCAHNIDYIDTLSMPAHPNYRKEVYPPRRG